MNSNLSRPTRTSGEKNESKFLFTCTPSQEANLTAIAEQLGISRNCLIRQLIDIGLGHFADPEQLAPGALALTNWGGKYISSRQDRWQRFIELATDWPGA